VDTVAVSEQPRITLRLGDPSILRWEDESGYLELEAGVLSAQSGVLNDLRGFWSGRWINWSYGLHNDRFALTLEMERIGEVVTLRLDFQHMLDHLGIDRSVVVTRPDVCR
jgi:hypothetical protein